jgi:hypothetical protein
VVEAIQKFEESESEDNIIEIIHDYLYLIDELGAFSKVTKVFYLD